MFFLFALVCLDSESGRDCFHLRSTAPMEQAECLAQRQPMADRLMLQYQMAGAPAGTVTCFCRPEGGG